MATRYRAMAPRSKKSDLLSQARWAAAPLLALTLAMVGFGTIVILRSSAAPQPNGPPGSWNMTFDDEFDGTSLNLTSWASSWFGGGSMNNVKTSPANVSVSGGNLTLTLSSSSTGALVDTDPHQAGSGYQFGYGYYAEARIFFPGSGSTIDNWPAWWTDGQSWPKDGEIDIAEGLGTLTSNYHSSSGANNSGTIPGTWASGWHTYGVDREPGKNYIWWDGRMVRSYNTNDGGSPQYLILNVGDGEGPTVTGQNGALKVDYVRVWQYSGPSTPTPTPSATPTATPTPSPTPSPMVGDLSGDGQVNICDLSTLLANWGTVNPAIESNLGHTGPVDVFDLSILLQHWTGGTGTC